MQPERSEPDRHDRIHRLIAGLRQCVLDEGQQLAVNQLEKTMLRGAPVKAPLSFTEAMTVFCNACDLCGKPLDHGKFQWMSSYPGCIEGGEYRPDEPDHMPACEKCTAELKRLGGVVPSRKKHEHGIFFCCLQELTVQVREYASEIAEVEPDKVEALFELLSLHVEEGWESFDGDIAAPDPYEEQRADFEDDVMSDLLKPRE